MVNTYIHLYVYVFTLQELSSVNYLELYRVADLFHLPALEEAVVGFLVEHLSELSQSRQDEALQLPYRLLREVLKSDRLTSLSEEEIWKVLEVCVCVFVCVWSWVSCAGRGMGYSIKVLKCSVMVIF